MALTHDMLKSHALMTNKFSHMICNCFVNREDLRVVTVTTAREIAIYKVHILFSAHCPVVTCPVIVSRDLLIHNPLIHDPLNTDPQYNCAPQYRQAHIHTCTYIQLFGGGRAMEVHAAA